MSKWRFPSNDYGEKKGINDSGIATFRGTPLRSLAREICQNSLDAARDKTVHIEFNAFDITSDKLPGSDVLKDTFERCAAFWNDQKAVTTKNFFANAIDRISTDRIHMLRISDFNTSGLTGSRAEVNTDWTNLTKSSGVSDKKGTSGGSFGIGKFAPFACSDFSTVFYSTYDEEGVQASQGVSRLVSFRREDGQTTQGVGYYGEERNTPTFKPLYLDPNFIRSDKQYGTDIYIAGYKHMDEEDGWEKSIIISILDSFLGAIWNEKLIVAVGGTEISKATLEDMIETYRDELTGYTERYYEVLTSPSAKWHEEDFMGLGTVRLGLLLGGQEMHRKVAMIRQTGMKIKDQDRISSFIPFAGVMFIDGDKINRELRVLENPEHTEWQVARADNEIQARALLKSINDFIRQRVEALASEGGQEDFDAAGLGTLLPDEPDESCNQAKEEAVTDKPIEIKKIIPPKHAAQTAGANTGGTEGKDIKEGGFVEGDSVLGYIHKDGHRGKGPHQDSYPVDQAPDGKSGSLKMQDILPQKLRIMCMDKNAGKYVVMFIPDADGTNGVIKFELSAETGSYPAPLVSASLIGQGGVRISGNKLAGVEFKKDSPLKVMLQLDYSDYCSMEVSACADKK